MTQPDPAFEALLEHLKASRGFDFTGYKRSSLMRRVVRRMAQVGVGSYTDYLDHLELHGDGASELEGARQHREGRGQAHALPARRPCNGPGPR